MKEQNTISLTFKPAWGAVYTVAIGVAGLVTSEFLPVSLLTPMAKDLGITEGLAGQAVAITAIVATFASLFTGIITQKFDRRGVLLVFCVLQTLSNLMVGFAPNFATLLIGRVLLGVGIGGFWGMAAATAIRLVPEKLVPKALSIIFGAVSVAAVIAAPLGSFLGAHIGWRNVFLIAAVVGLLALIGQVFTLPSMPNDKPAKLATLFHIFKRKGMTSGMFANLFVYIGYAAFFTYMRPFLENVAHVNTAMLSTILLGFGIANLISTTLSRYPLQWSMSKTLTLAPILMGIFAILLIVFGRFTVPAFTLITLWGLAYGQVQVGWIAWATRIAPDEAESVGGVQVAVIQLAITLGAAVGGLIFDHFGANGAFSTSSAVSFLAAIVASVAFKKIKGKNE